MKLKTTLAVAALLMGFSSAAAYADTVTFSLSNPGGYIPVTGGSETFNATVTAAAGNSAPVYLNGDSFNVTAPVTLDDLDFFTFAPAFLNPGQSATFAAFMLNVPAGAPFGTFVGSFSILGGSDLAAINTLGSASFALTTTPEPSSYLLLLTGLGGLAWVGTRGNRRSWAR